VGAIGHPAVPGTPRAPFDLFSFLDGDPDRTKLVTEAILGAWILDPSIRLDFFRPISSLTHALDFSLWPQAAWFMHLENIVLYALLIVLVGAVYRRFEASRWTAGLAVLLFAIDDARGVPVGWVSHRNALIAALFAMLALLAHDRACRDGWRAGRWLGPASFALALLSAEAGLAAGAYLLAYTLFVHSGNWLARFRSFLPYAAVVIVWRLGYSALGRGASGSDQYLDPVRDPLDFLAAVVTRLPTLSLGQWGLPPSDLWMLLEGSGRYWLALAGLAVIAALGWLGRGILARSATARFWACGSLLALVPSCATYPSDRLLLFSGIGAMALLAHFLEELTAPDAARPALWAAGALLAIHTIVAPLLLPLRSLEIVGAERLMEEGGSSLPTDADFERQELVIVTSPQLLHGPYALARRASLGEPLPDSVRILATTLGPMTLRREDERTLRMKVPSGLLPRAIDRLLRSRRDPLEPGDTIELDGFRAEVLATGPAGPTEVRFQFATALEDPDRRWLTWQTGAYRTFAPPPPGDSVALGTQP
jgi:hypothetical protein